LLVVDSITVTGAHGETVVGMSDFATIASSPQAAACGTP